MPTGTQIVNRILRGQLLQASLAKTYVEQEIVGNFFNYWDKSVYISQLVEGLLFQHSIVDYTSTTTLNIYNKLGGQLGLQFIDGASYDPNAQPIGPVVVVPIATVLGYNSDKIPFTSTELNPTVTLANYNTTYKQLYGNNPIVAIYDNQGQYIGDEQTPPVITYLNNDPTSDILSISWSYPPLPGTTTTGYIQISGVSPSAATGGGSGTPSTDVITLTFSQADLLNAGTIDEPNWYLPLLLPTNRVPAVTTVNSVSISTTYDVGSGSLYGFANNDTQVIKVTVI